MNGINNNVAWKLSECKINNNDVDFFVKLVHVDRYNDGQEGRKFSRSEKRSKSVSVNRHREDQPQKYEEERKLRDHCSVTPMNILHSISVWNQKKRCNRSVSQKNRNPFSHSQSTGMQCGPIKSGPTRHRRFYTQHTSLHEPQHRPGHSELPSNTSQQLDSIFLKKALRTQPSQFSDLKDSPTRSRSNKKQTIKQLVEYRKEKVLRKKEYHLKKFKATFNKAKFTNAFI